MAPLDEFIKRVRELRRQGCTENEIVHQVVEQYPTLCRTVDEAVRRIQKIERQSFNPLDW